MTRKPVILSSTFFLFLSLILFSFEPRAPEFNRNIGSTTLPYPIIKTNWHVGSTLISNPIIKPNRNIRSTLLSYQTIKRDTGGRAVSIDSAQACIDRYASLMAAHGFTDHAGEKVNIHIKKTSQITTGEAFNGKKLQDWLNATTEAYIAAGKTLMIKVQLGIYDMNYLNTYQPDANLRAANNNRMAIFIIPYDSLTGPTVRALRANVTSGSGGTPGQSGYDLGSVQP